MRCSEFSALFCEVIAFGLVPSDSIVGIDPRLFFNTRFCDRVCAGEQCLFPFSEKKRGILVHFVGLY